MTIAVEAYRTPSRFRRLRPDAVFSHMLTVIKAAAGDEETLAAQSSIYRMGQKELQEAARHLLLRHLMNSDVRGPRLLGLPDNATPAQLKDHKRWLLKWLHPDRNPSAWEQKLFHRINDYKLDSPAPAPIQRVRSSRKAGQRHRSWALALDRRRDASPRRVFLRVIRPLVASGICVILIALFLSTQREGLTKQLDVFVTWLK
jgi:hypothetical protein